MGGVFRAIGILGQMTQKEFYNVGILGSGAQAVKLRSLVSIRKKYGKV